MTSSILNTSLWAENANEGKMHSLAFTYCDSPDGVIVEIEKPPLTGNGWKDDIYASLKARFGSVSSVKYVKYVK
jgi:hypothetical protein